MNKCVKISVFNNLTEDFLKSVVQKNAQKYMLEGYSQSIDEESLRIVICGEKDDVDKFLDALHKQFINLDIRDFEIEPFLKERDYRGVFRIIQ